MEIEIKLVVFKALIVVDGFFDMISEKLIKSFW